MVRKKKPVMSEEELIDFLLQATPNAIYIPVEDEKEFSEHRKRFHENSKIKKSEEPVEGRLVNFPIGG